MSNESKWEINVDKLLSHPDYKRISKLGYVSEGWFRLNYKQKEAYINSHDSWDSIEAICKELLGNH